MWRLNLFCVKTIDETISSFEDYFRSIGTPVRLSDTSYGNYDKDRIISTMIDNKVSGAHHKLDEKDYAQLLDLMW